MVIFQIASSEFMTVFFYGFLVLPVIWHTRNILSDVKKGTKKKKHRLWNIALEMALELC